MCVWGGGHLVEWGTLRVYLKSLEAGALSGMGGHSVVYLESLEEGALSGICVSHLCSLFLFFLLKERAKSHAVFYLVSICV